jgi:hypothetical protein
MDECILNGIIFAEMWTRGGLWTARIPGIGFIAIGMFSATGWIFLPSDSVSSSDYDDEMIGMSMDMPSSALS